MIGSSRALLIYTIAMCGAFALSAFRDAPFLAFATQFTIGFVAYISKRIIQKRSEYGKNI
jgi:hypothetical protein